MVKTSINKAAHKYLTNIQAGHSKVNTIKYEKLQVQPYLKSSIFSNEDVSVLSSLRSHTVRGIRCNFKNLYRDNTNCPLNCSDKSPQQDTQQHLLECSAIKLEQSYSIARSKVNYNDIYGDIYEQKKAVTLFRALLDARNFILSVGQH